MAPGQRAALVSLALYGRADDGGGGERAALLVTGIYGKPLPKQHGAPIRLITPWKYGFKSVKSIAQDQLRRRAAEDLLGGAAGAANTASGPM